MELSAIMILLLITAFLSVVLRRYQPELSIGVSIVAGIVVLVAILRTLLPTVQTIREMLDGAAVPTVYVGVLFKALGICLLTQIAADTCRDAGESALAAKAEFVGKTMLLVISLPLFREITEVALSLMRGEP